MKTFFIKMTLAWTFPVVLMCFVVSCKNKKSETGQLPNIVYILADDLGYGDVSAYNEHAAWMTPAIDRLAAEGIRFTDAHSGSAVCTPTRYGILTGRYAWRTRLKEGVLWSWSKPLIEPERLTVPALLKQKGYESACIGKWHLGLGWQYSEEDSTQVDFSKPVLGGPTSLGFDYFYGITASLDIPPYVYIENDRATVVPEKYTESKDKYGWWRKGLTGSDFDHHTVLSHLTDKAIEFIQRHQEKNKKHPFFLYFALTAPHTPILPEKAFQGKSGTNPYGDFVLQVDYTVDRVLKALEEEGIADNTVVFFTSDNGCSPAADYKVLAEYGHDPSYIYRGTKADIFEGGHRIPFIVRWPGMIQAGLTSDETICLTDLMATAARIADINMPSEAGEDSYNITPLLFNHKLSEPIREATVHHSINGSFAIRKANWKLIMCPGSGGWSPPRPGTDEVKGLPPIQLYDMSTDPEEQENVYKEFPEVVKELRSLLISYIENGRSNPGPLKKLTKKEIWPQIEWIKEDQPLLKTGTGEHH